MKRRTFIQHILGMGMINAYPFKELHADTTVKKTPITTTLLSAYSTPHGQHFISYHQPSNEMVNTPIPFRAHAVQNLANTNKVIAFGRRPSNQSALFDLQENHLQVFTAHKNRHFYGHGCTNNNASLLFTTENDFINNKGVIGIRDSHTLAVLGEYHTHMIGPHDIHLMPDGNTLAIAIGGIQTHPDYGRRKLNIKTMQPALLYMDSQTGKILDTYYLDEHKLSIRHLTVTPHGDIGVATQYQGDSYSTTVNTLVAWQAHGTDQLQPLPLSSALIKQTRGYIADLVIDYEHSLLIASAPRGNQILVWNLKNNQYLYNLTIPEPSGITFIPSNKQKNTTSSIVISSAKGTLYTLDIKHDHASIIQHKQYEDTYWDNHLTLLNNTDFAHIT